MSLPGRAALLSLACLLFLDPIAPAAVPRDTHHPAPVHILAASAPTRASLRDRATAHLASPDLDIALLGLGVLLLFAECNLPGAILPGAIGLLLLLSAVYGLLLHPLNPAALVAILAAIALLSVSTVRPLFGLPAVLGTAALVFGLLHLVVRSPSGALVHPSLAIAVGLAVGASASLLGRVASRARRNKAILASGSDPKALGE